MEIFWNTIARYNAATWPWQIAIVAAAAVLTVLLYLRPTQNVKRAMKLFLAGLNAWIAVVYYLVWCGQRSHSDVLALFWGIMAVICSTTSMPISRASSARAAPSASPCCSTSCRWPIRSFRWLGGCRSR